MNFNFLMCWGINEIPKGEVVKKGNKRPLKILVCPRLDVI